MRTKFSKLLSILLCLVMALGTLPTVALAAGGYGESELLDGPNMSGTVINVNAENAQYTLDGAYGPIDGMTINFTESINTVLHIGRPTKYAGSNTSYYVAGFTDTVPNFQQFNTAADLTAYKSSSVWTPYCYYSRTISNVKFTSNENVTLAGFDMSGATGHNYEPGYDFVRDKALTNGTNDGYYGHININGLTFEGLTINNTTDDYAINFYITSCTERNELQNIAFNNCSISSSKSGAASFMNNGGTADIYKGISFNGCTLNVSNSVETNTYGVLTFGVGDLTVNGCRISGMTRAVQTQSASSGSTAQNEYGKFIVTNNTFDNVKTYVIKVAATSNITGITITGNTSTNSASGCQVRLEPAAYGGSGECVIRGNTWDSNIGYKYDWNKDAIPVAQIDDTLYGTLAAAIDAAEDGDTVTLLADVAYETNGSGLFNITKSITLDGNGHKISGYGSRSGNNTTLAINFKGTEKVSVELKNLTIDNAGNKGRAVETRGNIESLKITNCKFNCTGGGNTQVLTIGGNQSKVAHVTIDGGSVLSAGAAGYPIIVYNPMNLQMSDNSKLTGYCGIYFKGVDGSEGSHGSVVNATNCVFDCPNIYDGADNTFGVFTLEDDDITIKLMNCHINAEATRTAQQAVFLASSSAAADRRSKYDFSIGGNSVVNGTILDFDWTGNPTENHKISITGGTFSSDVSAYVTGSAKQEELEDGTYTVRPLTANDPESVAKVNDTYYTTLAAAITAAQNGDTVTLLKDVDLGSNTLTINKKITLDGGAEKHSITSTVGGAVVDINTSERVTIQNLKIFATASGKTGRGIAINDNAAKLDVKNVEIEATQRGITVNTNANDGIVLNVEDSMISLVEPGKTAAEYDYSKTVLSTNDYNNSRGISLWEMANSTVTLKNTTVQGFFYNINSAGSNPSTGMKVSATGCTFKGRAAVNQHVAETEYTLTNCDITGINNFGGGSEGFGCIVVYQGATGNSITVNGGSIACVSFNEIGAANPNANEYLIDDRAGNNTFTLNNMTYTCPREYGDSKGGIVKAIRPGSVITVNGGTYTMPELVDASYSDNGEVGQMNILGGNFTYNVVSVNVSDPDVKNALNITGGTFSSDPTAYVAGGYIAKKNSETEYAVIAKSGLTGGVYMSDPTDYTAANHYVTKNNDGTWTVFYVAPYVAPTYSITVDSAKHGDVTVSPRDASKGDKVTITVESGKGYTLETLTVTDKNGDEIELTNKGDGKYTFTMPAGKVYVEATFMEDNSMLNFFVDVFPGDYYYDAVLWAVKNGITGGVDAAHFAPNATCTRAQVVTFLWRAAGSPAPKSSMMPFTDVPAGSYYETAVLWAAENGITGGTGNNAFSPDAACTRGQIVSFLWRALGSPAAGTVNPFTDVAADTYYNTAVLWAAENGITGGTGNNAFSPDADCTRAQIVTFLYRSAT